MQTADGDALDVSVVAEGLKLRHNYYRSLANTPLWCLVQISRQRLLLFEDDTIKAQWPVSTSRNGMGCATDSYCTPTGPHRIYECIGAGAPVHTVFVHRKPTDEICELDADASADIITTRILWLEGLQYGFNKGGLCDSQARFIYIHGTNQEHAIGTPASVGCVRMRGADIVELFDSVRKNMFVWIVP